MGPFAYGQATPMNIFATEQSPNRGMVQIGFKFSPGVGVYSINFRFKQQQNTNLAEIIYYLTKFGANT
jgi:hypothetical protein